MSVNMFYSSKGGTGKSSGALMCCKEFPKMGYKTLGVDCDPQANLSKTLLKDRMFDDDYISMADLFKRKVNPEMVRKSIQHVDENLDMIGSSIMLVNSERDVSTDMMCDTTRVLEKILNCVKDDYDVIFLDFNPYPSLLTTNGFIVSDFVIIPTNCDEWGADGVAYTLSQIHEIEENIKNEPIKFKVLINMKGRNNDDQEFEDEIASQLDEGQLFKTSIHYQAKPFKDKDESVIDFKDGNTTVGKEWRAIIEEIESEVVKNG